MNKLVWDTSAIVNMKEPRSEGYSPGHSIYKDFNDGWIEGSYLNIFPALAVFEVEVTVSKKQIKVIALNESIESANRKLFQ